MKCTCKDCGQNFELTDGEIQFYKSKKLSLPKRCKECRGKKKGTNTNVQSVNVVTSATPSQTSAPKKKAPITAAIITIFLAIFAIFVPNLFENDGAENLVTSQGVVQNAQQLDFKYADSLTEHFEKHRDEFDGYSTEQEYLDGANRVINDPNALKKTEAEDGDLIYYLSETNEIVFVSTDGYIRTYFRPSTGQDYFDRQ